MPELLDGETTTMQGSGSKPYVLKNVGGVYSCSCPAWRNQSLPIEQRTCKHIRKLRGDDAENARLGTPATPTQTKPTAAKARPTPMAGVLLAETWDGITDPAGMLMSEKLDGIRAVWNGKMFLSRQGNQFYAPAWFTKGLPDRPLDGELWLGRKQFQKTMSIVRRQDMPQTWDQIHYLVFDAPDESSGFSERLSDVRTAVREANSQYILAHDHMICSGVDSLNSFLNYVEGLGGEGLMLRDPDALHTGGRSSTLLKVKRFLDGEAIVTGHTAGKGKYKGMTGALEVQSDGSGVEFGTRFEVGSGLTDAQRRSPPPIGTKIQFKYQELTDGGVPRFPTFLRVV